LELNAYSKEQLVALEQSLTQRYDDFKKAALNLDLTRGKPAADQLDLSNAMENALNGNFRAADGTDVRNYGGLEGLPEMRAFGAQLLGVKPSETLAAGNSSLTLMYQYVQFCALFGAQGADSAWKNEGTPKFLCPVPGYDRHFTICEALGIEMLNVPMTATGPDMDQVEAMVKNDKQIKGIWCVPKYSNPSGEIYSDDTVDRMAQLGKIAGANFRIMWDNAYTVHDLIDNPPQLTNLMDKCRQYGTEDSVCITGSTSKITMAGAGVAFIGLSEKNLKHFCAWLSSMTIGPDKINQLRHARFLPTFNDLLAHMKKHAALIKPKFDLVQKHLSEGLTGKGMGNWTVPQGGYFISFDTLNGLAKEVIKLTNEMGVKLTPAGSTFPYKKDPNDCNIRIAPTFPNLAEIDKAMPVFICAVELASVRQRLKSL
jgi:aspartate/methionine/tyrosine aminotransferase